MTDVELDARVMALEENGGGAKNGKLNDTFLGICIFFYDMKIIQACTMECWISYVLETIAFHSILTSYSTIPFGSAVLFNEVLLNEGDG